MKLNNGFILIHRQLLEWEWYDDLKVCRLFIHCLLKANHSDQKYKGKLVKRGTFLTSRDLLSRETGLTVREVRTSLNKLISTNELTNVATRKGSVITVVNYDKYQKATNKKTKKRPTSDQQATTNNNEKNEKNENNIPTRNEFLQFAFSKKSNLDKESVELKYQAWVENNWRDGNDKPIKNCKIKLTNTIPYLKEDKPRYQENVWIPPKLKEL